MYPALQQLEDEGLVRVEESAAGRIFHLTDAGSKEAKAHKHEPPPWDPAVIGEGHKEIGELREIIHQVMLAVMQVGRAGTPTQRAEARKVLTEARRALYRILAEDMEDEQ
jgi:DNA-binding PadR family transcriptional regulator